MIKREYKLFKSVDDKIALTVLYDREDYEIITTFMITEVTDFYLYVREALENVISGNMEEYAFDGNLLGIEIGKDITEVYYQMDDESFGDPCFIPTNHEKEEYLDLVQKLEEFDYSLATYFRQLID